MQLICSQFPFHTVLLQQAGLQEKSTFLQVFGKKPVYSGYIAIPALIVVMLVMTGLLVLYHHAPTAQSPARKGYALASSSEEERIVSPQPIGSMHDV